MTGHYHKLFVVIICASFLTDLIRVHFIVQMYVRICQYHCMALVNMAAENSTCPL